MRFALLSPVYPPSPGGVADHTQQLERALLQLGHEVRIWQTRVLESHLEQEFRDFQPTAVLIQYTPYLWGPHSFGVSLRLALWVTGLSKRINATVVLMAHEVNYPLSLSPRGLLIGLPQALLFGWLALVSSGVLFTTRLAQRRCQKLLPWRAKYFRFLPVGASILPASVASSASNSNARVLLAFGTQHPSRLLGHCFRALDVAMKTLPQEDVRLSFVGCEPSEVFPALRAQGYAHLESRVSVDGYVSHEEASRQIQSAEVVLAPFVDGVSTRRTTVMSALAHGKPLATTRAWSTDRETLWEEVAALSDAAEPSHYAAQVVGLLKEPTRALELGRRAKETYAREFSWSVIARKLVGEVAQINVGSDPSTPGASA